MNTPMDFTHTQVYKLVALSVLHPMPFLNKRSFLVILCHRSVVNFALAFAVPFRDEFGNIRFRRQDLSANIV